MEHSHISIVGAGVVGLAIASRLSADHKDILLLEKHDGFGRETSSRNSEVIHAGFNYPSHSLKAILCLDGNRKLYELCQSHAIGHRQTGKIVVANSEDEIERLHLLHAQGRENGVAGIELLSREQVRRMEPNVNARLGLYSPSTGIVDTHVLMKYFETEALSRSVTIGYSCLVQDVSRDSNGYRVRVLDADREEMDVHSDIVINCAGLCSGDVAAMAGIGIDEAGYRIRPCKGEYFAVSNRRRGMLSHLVYPAPTAISLGVHAVLKLDGSLKLGPNAFYVETLSYDVDESHRNDFFAEASAYLPFLEPSDLSPDMSGIRPKIQAPGDAFRDFVIREEGDKGLPGFIDLVGIESPGLTAAPAIADYVARIVDAL